MPFASNVPLSQIADALNMSKQAVSRHVKNGMPTTSVETAVDWYEMNVRKTRSRRPHLHNFTKHAAPAWTPPAPVKLDTFPADFWQDDPVEQIALTLGEDAAEITTADDAVRFCGAVLHAVLGCIRTHVLMMPTLAAEAANPDDPEAAERALDQWAALFMRRWSGEDWQESARIFPPMATSLKEGLEGFNTLLKR
jgi:hypothetical protein